MPLHILNVKFILIFFSRIKSAEGLVEISLARRAILNALLDSSGEFN